MITNTSVKRSPLTFFVLVFALSVPFWLLGALVKQPKGLPMNLPVSSLMAVCPMIAACILVYREEKGGGIKRLLKRIFDYRSIRPKIWYAPILSLMPLIMVLSYAVMRLLGRPLPAPDIALLTIPLLFVVFFLSAAGEEAGWMGYAVDPLQERWSAVATSLLLGLMWAVWHVVPYLQADHNLAWIAWQCVFTVVARLLIVWLYNNTRKSVLAAILFHDMIDVSVSVFPIYGSLYDPAITAVITAVIAAIVTFFWGPKTLACFRYVRSDSKWQSQ